MSVQAVIPVKPLGRALGRLAAVLAPAERRDLQAAMLADLLDACRGCAALDALLVVTSDPAAGQLAAGFGARLLPDHAPPQGMNAAVAIGRADAARQGRRALVLTADLPLTRPEDLAAIVAAAPAVAGGVVLVPSRDGTGTNALLLDPAEAMPTRLGPDSRAQHAALARERGLVLTELALPRIALDVDTPADLAPIAAGAHGWCRTTEVCVRHGLAGRLTVGTAP
ncbi:MAG TPA: 2-phospho-L-lactate guanylyltransferase [Miltoncostaeaceae bacterium]|nr:2-phospho-L-lactate guanylyltransferase [Miltoncostaeaceae bacterium]